MKKKSVESKNGRIVAFLTREEVDFVDKLSKDALFSTGHKLSRTEVIRALLDALIKVCDINAYGIASKDGLENRVLSVMKAVLPRTLSGFKSKNEEKRGNHENL